MKPLAGLALTLAVILSNVPAASAATTTESEHLVMDQVNAARAALGLVPLRADSRLWDLAGDRAATMASHNVLSHTVAGSLSGSLNARGISWYGNGETIGYTTASRGRAAAISLFQAWRGSPHHWTLLMSDRYNYLGVGMAYRSSNGRTFGSIVLTESRDHSGARAVVVSANRSGDDIRWTWRGWDPRLQTHTAGLRDFTVQMRRGYGAWVTVLTHTTATARRSLNRTRGHWYGLRVRARDRLGNIGPWSAERRVWVP